MGIFNSIFGNKNTGHQGEENTVVWIPLTSLDQLNTIEERSSNRPQFIFKHSTSCGISSMVMKMFRDKYSLESDQADLYYLDLHSFRQLSNEVANRFNVRHQSPQLLVIKNGAIAGHNSHGAITEMDLEMYL